MMYKDIIANYTAEQLLQEQRILRKEKQNLYIKEKELENEIDRRFQSEQ